MLNLYKGTVVSYFEREPIQNIVIGSKKVKKKCCAKKLPPAPIVRVKRNRHEKTEFDIDELDLQLNKYEVSHRRALANWKAVKLRLQIL